MAESAKTGLHRVPPRTSVSAARGLWVSLSVLVVLPLAVMALTMGRAAWVTMWAMAVAVWVGCKCVTLALAVRVVKTASPARLLAYMLAWPGMNAAGFLDPETRAPRPASTEAAKGAGRLLLGMVLLWIIARHCAHPLVAGWVGLFGTVLILHFGAFDLLSWGWRSVGIEAPPLMRHPANAMSLSDFWARWNTGFHQLVNQAIFLPVRGRLGSVVSIVVVFGISGLLHDVVISIPARGGYGLPTGYFAFQAAGLLFQHTPFAHRLGLHWGRRGRLFTVLAVAAPACGLFHSPFIHNVMVPFMHAIKAL